MSGKLLVADWSDMQDVVVTQWEVKHYALPLSGDVTSMEMRILSISALR